MKMYLAHSGIMIIKTITTKYHMKSVTVLLTDTNSLSLLYKRTQFFRRAGNWKHGHTPTSRRLPRPYHREHIATGTLFQPPPFRCPHTHTHKRTYHSPLPAIKVMGLHRWEKSKQTLKEP